jgi:hypothetical protein
VPFGLFWIYYRAIASVQALERVNTTSATSHAIGLAFATKDGELPPSLKDDLRDAFLLEAE